MMEPAAEATLGQISAHSLATGPVIADPFISPLGLTMTPALSIHTLFLLRYANLFTFTVDEDTFISSPWLSLSDNDSL